jgi:O-glycosyl hydrolase
MVIRHASVQGLQVIARLGFVPEWARPNDTSPLYLDEDNYGAFGDYVYEFVQRYGEQVSYIIVWNEPNLSLEWGYRPVDPASYVEMLRVAYTRAKEANPAVQVLGGALAPTVAPPGSEWGMDDLRYLQAMYDAGAAPYFDVLAVHAYGGKFPPDEPAAADAINFARTELLREVMVRNGDGDKPVMITEGGWNDHPRWTRAVRPGQRIAYTLRAYQKALEEWPWVNAVALWAFRYPAPARTYQDYYTFVTPDFQPKAIYLEAQRYAQGGGG